MNQSIRVAQRGATVALAFCVACTSTRENIESNGFYPDSIAQLDQFLNQQVEDGVIPGGTMIIGGRSGIAHATTFGSYADDDPRPVALNTIYDLASLTKVVGLTTATYMLLADDRLTLETPVQTFVPEFEGSSKATVTVRNLLTHTSGLPAWIPLHLETANREDALDRIFHEPLTAEPGTAYVYSDLGAILMAQIVERVASQSLDVFLRDNLFQPLGMVDTGFNPSSELLTRIAPTENDPWRDRVVHGEVHDENAFHLGGVSGHAGLFSTAEDLAKFAEWMLSNFAGDTEAGLPTLQGDRLREWTALQPGSEGSNRAIGWQKPVPGGGNSAGTLLSPESFGHTGFTGTSIWIDPSNDIYLVLLTNRVHPTRENQRWLPLRAVIADMVMRARVPTD